jgi:glycosyltransferase involved in cell wall biosynthesis
MGREVHASGYEIYRVPVAPRGAATAPRLAANYLSFMLNASVIGPWMLRGQRFDVVFVYGISPIIQTAAAIVLKHFTGASVVTWVQDLWPQSLEVTGFVKNQMLLESVEIAVRWLYRHSDLLLVQSNSFLDTVRQMAGDTPVEYHPNPGELAFGQERAPEAPALVLKPGFNVVFAGNLGTVQALDTLLAAAELLRSHKDIRLVLIGSGSRGASLEEAVKTRALDNVQLAGRFPPEAMPAILDQASALLVSLIRSPIMSQTIPSKVQAYLAAGRPIIAALDGEGALVVEEARAGITCPAEDAGALAHAILALYRAPAEERKRMGDAGRSYYEKNFDPTALARRLAQRFQRVVARKEQRTPLTIERGLTR